MNNITPFHEYINNFFHEIPNRPQSFIPTIRNAVNDGKYSLKRPICSRHTSPETLQTVVDVIKAFKHGLGIFDEELDAMIEYLYADPNKNRHAWGIGFRIYKLDAYDEKDTLPLCVDIDVEDGELHAEIMEALEDEFGENGKYYLVEKSISNRLHIIVRAPLKILRYLQGTLDLCKKTHSSKYDRKIVDKIEIFSPLKNHRQILLYGAYKEFGEDCIKIIENLKPINNFADAKKFIKLLGFDFDKAVELNIDAKEKRSRSRKLKEFNLFDEFKSRYSEQIFSEILGKTSGMVSCPIHAPDRNPSANILNGGKYPRLYCFHTAKNEEKEKYVLHLDNGHMVADAIDLLRIKYGIEDKKEAILRWVEENEDLSDDEADEIMKMVNEASKRGKMKSSSREEIEEKYEKWYTSIMNELDGMSEKMIGENGSFPFFMYRDYYYEIRESGNVIATPKKVHEFDKFVSMIKGRLFGNDKLTEDELDFIKLGGNRLKMGIDRYIPNVCELYFKPKPGIKTEFVLQDRQASNKVYKVNLFVDPLYEERKQKIVEDIYDADIDLFKKDTPYLYHFILSLANGNKTSASMIIQWLANTIKIYEHNRVLVLWGEQKTGKTTLHEIISYILNPEFNPEGEDENNKWSYASRATLTELVRSNFQYAFHRKYFITIDETEQLPNDSETLKMNSEFIKSKTGNPNISFEVNLKYLPPERMEGPLAFLICSNYAEIVEIEGVDERRYAIVHTKTPLYDKNHKYNHIIGRLGLVEADLNYYMEKVRHEIPKFRNILIKIKPSDDIFRSEHAKRMKLDVVKKLLKRWEETILNSVIDEYDYFIKEQASIFPKVGLNQPTPDDYYIAFNMLISRYGLFSLDFMAKLMSRLGMKHMSAKNMSKSLKKIAEMAGIDYDQDDKLFKMRIFVLKNMNDLTTREYIYNFHRIEDYKDIIARAEEIVKKLRINYGHNFDDFAEKFLEEYRNFRAEENDDDPDDTPPSGPNGPENTDEPDNKPDTSEQENVEEPETEPKTKPEPRTYLYPKTEYDKADIELSQKDAETLCMCDVFYLVRSEDVHRVRNLAKPLISLKLHIPEDQNDEYMYDTLLGFNSKGFRLGREMERKGLRYFKFPKEIVIRSLIDKHISDESYKPLHRYENHNTIPTIIFDIESVNMETIEDGETLRIKPESGNIVCIALRNEKGEEIIFNEGNERKIIEDFNRYLHEHDPKLVVGYNILEYDIPHLIYRMEELGVGNNWFKKRFSIYRNREGRHVIYQKTDTKLLTHYAIVDLYQIVVNRYGNRFRGGRRLVNIYNEITGENVELEVKEKDLMKAGEMANRQVLQDIRMTKRVYDELFPLVFGLHKLVPMSITDLCRYGERTIWKSILFEQYLNNGLAIKCKPQPRREVSGAKTEIYISGEVIRNVMKVDVRSLYPHIMVYHNVRPINDYASFFTKSLRKFIDERIAWKKKAKNDSFADLMQNALKIIINSAYGVLGLKMSDAETYDEYGEMGMELLYDPIAASMITGIGRALLTKMEEVITSCGNKLIEVDTDGIYYQDCVNMGTEAMIAEFKNGNHEFEAINEHDNSIVIKSNLAKFDYEGDEYDAMYTIRKKNYALLLGDKVKMYGNSLISVAQSEFEKQLKDYIINSIFKEIEEGEVSLEYLQEKADEFIENNNLYEMKDPMYFVKFSKNKSKAELHLKDMKTLEKIKVGEDFEEIMNSYVDKVDYDKYLNNIRNKIVEKMWGGQR